MSDDFPRMLYREGGDEDIFGLKCETRIVADADEEQSAADEGFRRTAFEAHGVEPPKADPIEEAPPLDVERDVLSGEISQLSRDLETVQHERVALSEELAREREAHEATKKELGETRELLAEATKPVEKPKQKETLSVNAGAKGG